MRFPNLNNTSGVRASACGSMFAAYTHTQAMQSNPVVNVVNRVFLGFPNTHKHTHAYRESESERETLTVRVQSTTAHSEYHEQQH